MPLGHRDLRPTADLQVPLRITALSLCIADSGEAGREPALSEAADDLRSVKAALIIPPIEAHPSVPKVSICQGQGCSSNILCS